MLDFANELAVSSDIELAALALALALGARDIQGWSESEEAIARTLPSPSPPVVSAAHEAIRRGEDPLGDAFCRILSPDQRRPMGATYTPDTIVAAMLAWASAQLSPARVVDPGAGSGRFLAAAGRTFPHTELVAVEIDPLAAILPHARSYCGGGISVARYSHSPRLS